MANFLKFDKIIIKNGYKKNAPTLEFQHVSTDVVWILEHQKIDVLSF